MRLGMLVCVVAWAGCARQPQPPAPPVALAPAPGLVAPLPAVATAVRWLPRVQHASRALQKPYEGVGIFTPTGPHQGEEGTDATVYLGEGRAGLLHGGRRYVFSAERLTLVEAPDAPALTRVIARSRLLGFVFVGPGGIYAAPTFEAPPLRITPDQDAFEALAPRAVVLTNGEMRSTDTGALVPNLPPLVDHTLTHSALGFALARTPSDNKHVWYTKDGSAWTRLTLPGVTAPRSDHIVFFQHEDRIVASVNDQYAFTVDVAGHVRRVPAHDDWQVTQTPLPAPVEDLYEGALLVAPGWSHTRDDEWFTVAGNEPFLAAPATRTRRRFGAPVGRPRDTCRGFLHGGAAFVHCYAVGEHWSLSRVDLHTGVATIDRAIEGEEVRSYDVQVDARIDPSAIHTTLGCDLGPGHCVRDAKGVWSNHAEVDPFGRTHWLSFLGEDVRLDEDLRGNLVLSSDRRGTRTFTSTELDQLAKTLNAPRHLEDPVHESPVVLTFELQTAAGIRRIYSPNPLLPMPAAPFTSWVDLSFDPKVPITIDHIAGVAAVAGRRALRLAEGRLWETADGFHTWHEVAPPPTGVPSDLAAAFCTESGCVLGPWARIGWHLP